MAVVGELSVLLSLIPKDFDKGLDLIQRLSSAAKMLLGVQAMKSVLGWVEHTAEAATHLNSLAQSMGLSVGKAQELGFVADASGSSLTQLSIGVNMLERKLRDFAAGRGGKALAADMAEIGIHSHQAAQMMLKEDGIMGAIDTISNKFAKMGNSGERVALADKMFGPKAARGMIADLSNPQRMAQLMAQRKAMGELDQKDVNNLRDLRTSMKVTEGTFQNMGATVLARLAPAFIRMAEAAQKWIVENKDIITGAFEAALKGIAFVFEIIGGIIDSVVQAVRWFAGVLKDVEDGSVGVTLAVAGIGAIILAFVIPAVVAWLSSMVTGLLLNIFLLGMMADAAIAAMLPFLPWILLIAAIAVGAYFVIKHWTAVKHFFSELWTSIVNGVKNTWEHIKNFGSDVADFFKGVWTGIGDALKAVFDWMTNLPVIKQILEAINWARGEQAEKNSAALGEDHPYLKGLLQATSSGVATSMYERPTGNVPAGSPGAGGGSAPASAMGGTNVTQNVNINGVAGAHDVPNAIAKSADILARRNAFAALTGGR